MFNSPNFSRGPGLGARPMQKSSKWVWEIGWGRRVESREVVMFSYPLYFWRLSPTTLTGRSLHFLSPGIIVMCCG